MPASGTVAVPARLERHWSLSPWAPASAGRYCCVKNVTAGRNLAFALQKMQDPLARPMCAAQGGDEGRAAAEIQSQASGPLRTFRTRRTRRTGQQEACRPACVPGLLGTRAAVAREARDPALGLAFRNPGPTEP